MASEGSRRFRLGSGHSIHVEPRKRRSAQEEDEERATPTSFAWSAKPMSRSPPSQGSRAIGRAPPGTTVTLLGCGSVGSHLGIILAQMGYSLVAIDKDIVEASNLEAGRSAYPEWTIGLPKVIALAETVKRLRLGVAVHPFYCGIEDLSDDELLSLTFGSAAVAVVFDDVAEILRVNELIYSSCKVVYAAFHRTARTAHVVWTVPGVPCFQCASGITSASDIHTLHGERALPLDIQKLSAAAAEMILALTNPEDPELAGLIHPENTFILFNNRPYGAAGDGRSRSPIEAVASPDCGICGPYVSHEGW